MCIMICIRKSAPSKWNSQPDINGQVNYIKMQQLRGNEFFHVRVQSHLKINAVIEQTIKQESKLLMI